MAIDLQTIFQQDYIYSFIVFIGFFVIAKLVVYISEKIILKLTAKTKTKIDDLIVKKTNRPISFILILIGLRLALLPLTINEKFESTTQQIIITFIIILIAYIIAVIIDIVIDSWGKKFAEKTESKLDDQLITLFHRSSKIIIYILAILFILQHWGVQIGPLLASLGIAGLAIAFALQPTLSNLFGGISLIIDRTIKVGDIIKLDSGEMGVVHDIGIRSTRIRTWDNELITVPNGKLVDSQIQNFSQPDPSARINIEFGVVYGSDPDKVKKLTLDTVKNIKNVLKEPAPRILFLNMGDFALQFKLMIWVDELSKKWDTHQEAITKLYKALNKAKIGIPFPTRTIYMRNMDKKR